MRNTLNSTSFGSGSLVVRGGAGIARDVFIGGKVDISNSLDVSGITTIRNTTAATSSTAAAFVVKGGVGITGNIIIGTNAILRTENTGTNLVFGLNSKQTVGFNNTAFGQNSMINDVSQNNNSALGYQALQNCSGGYDNVAVGANTLDNTPYNGYYNTAVGSNALTGLLSGSNHNTALGYNAGSTIQTGANNIVIGSGAQPTTGTTSDEITIGTFISPIWKTGLFRMDASSARFSCNATTTSTTSAALTVVGGIGLGGAIYQW